MYVKFTTYFDKKKFHCIKIQNLNEKWKSFFLNIFLKKKKKNNRKENSVKKYSTVIYKNLFTSYVNSSNKSCYQSQQYQL